jgi:hypothetical protein
MTKKKILDDQNDDIIILNSNEYDTMFDGGAVGCSDSGISTITLSDYVTLPNSVLSSTGSSYAWTQDYSLSTTTKSNVHITGDGITMEPAADIKIGDRSLKEFMNTVDEHLAILRPAPELEEKWDQLKDLRQQYETLKADILEKEKIMTILKKA